MLESASLAAVDAARWGDRWVRPLYDTYGFAHLPRVVHALFAGDRSVAVPFDPSLVRDYDCVVLMLVDAFGWRSFERFADHPFLVRMVRDGSVAQLTSQFPSTTTAHVTTLHTGQPVGEHGLYEWYLYEPTADAMIAPLLFSYAGDYERERLRGTIDPAALYPTTTLYQSLEKRGVRSTVLTDRAYADSPFNTTVCAGATRVGFDGLADGLHALTAAIANERGPSYCVLYYDAFDHACHEYGPQSPQADYEAQVFLGAMEQQFHSAMSRTGKRCLFLMTADHGQTALDPATTIYLNHTLPQITRWLRRNQRGLPLVPAGSARDFFLHIEDAHMEEATATLRDHLAGRAEVFAVDDLVRRGFFGTTTPSATFRQRVGDLVVCPYRGESVWWYEAGRFANSFYGSHGGLTDDEMLTIVYAYAYG